MRRAIIVGNFDLELRHQTTKPDRGIMEFRNPHMAWKNRLYFGDSLKVLREEIPDEHVALIYLDPPFNSNANYNVLFAEKSGEKSAAQIAAFTDTWHWCEDSESGYSDVVLKGGKRIELPHYAPAESFKKAPAQKKGTVREQGSLL
jgi:adenine specific DNA methylase Mod